MVVIGSFAIALSPGEQDVDDRAATAPVKVDGEPLPELAGDPGTDPGIGAGFAALHRAAQEPAEIDR